FKVVGTLHAGRRLADLLDGGQEQADEDGDDGDHHQQLDQRKRLPDRVSIPGHGKPPHERVESIQPGGTRGWGREDPAARKGVRIGHVVRCPFGGRPVNGLSGTGSVRTGTPEPFRVARGGTGWYSGRGLRGFWGIPVRASASYSTKGNIPHTKIPIRLSCTGVKQIRRIRESALPEFLAPAGIRLRTSWEGMAGRQVGRPGGRLPCPGTRTCGVAASWRASTPRTGCP